MLYLSQVLGRPIREVEGERVATLKDVIVRLGEDHPPVTGLVARYRRRDFFVPRAHPVEIARLTEALSRHHGSEVIEALDDETAAETLEEMHAEDQARIIGDMEEERAADILEHMSPDEAADVLGDLPEEKAEDLLELMEHEEKADVE